MDLVNQFVDFGHQLSYGGLPAPIVQRAKERLIDTIACAIGAQGCDTADMALHIASTARSPELAGRIIGTADTVAADAAAFINTNLIRYLDFNDAFPGIHPSDSLGALLAVAPQTGASGADLIVATVVAYEVASRIQQSAHMNERGWDQGLAISVGTAVALGRLVGLSWEQTRHATAIAAVANMQLRATRSGQLSMWKSAATAHATRNAVYAVQLASVGMTGPEAPFTGRDGLEDLVTGPLEIKPFGSDTSDFLIAAAKTKYWPVTYNMQALVWAARDLRDQVSPDTLDAVDVSTYHGAWRESGSEPAKWDPRSRETADHSIPYVLAWSLHHGSVDRSAFEPEAFLNPSMRPLMNRVTVRADPAIAGYPDDITLRLDARDRRGRSYHVSVTNPVGHERNPLSREQLESKLRGLARAQLTDAETRRALENWWAIEEHSAAEALDALVGGSAD